MAGIRLNFSQDQRDMRHMRTFQGHRRKCLKRPWMKWRHKKLNLFTCQEISFDALMHILQKFCQELCRQSMIKILAVIWSKVISVNISEYQWNRFNPKVSGPTTAFWEDRLCRIYLYLYLYLYSIEYRVQQKSCSPHHTKYKTILPRQEDSLFWPFKLNSCPGCQLSPCKWLGAVALNIQQDGHRVHTRIVTSWISVVHLVNIQQDGHWTRTGSA